MAGRAVFDGRLLILEAVLIVNFLVENQRSLHPRFSLVNVRMGKAVVFLVRDLPRKRDFLLQCNVRFVKIFHFVV